MNKCIFIDDIAMRFWTESWIVYPCIRFKYFSLRYTDNMEFLTDFSIVSRHLMTTLNELPYQFSWIYFQSTEKTFKRKKEYSNSRWQFHLDSRIFFFFWKQSKSIIGLALKRNLVLFFHIKSIFHSAFKCKQFRSQNHQAVHTNHYSKKLDKIPKISIDR